MINFEDAFGNYLPEDDQTTERIPNWYNHLCDCKMCEQYRLDLLDLAMELDPFVPKELPSWDETYDFIEQL